MLIKVPLTKDKVARFVIKNKWIDKAEKIKGRALPYLRYINLFHKEGKYAYLPIAAHPEQLPLFLNHELPEPVSYDPPPIESNNDMFEAIKAEQDYVLSEVMKQDTGLIVMKTARWKSHVVMRITNNFQGKTLVVCHNQKTLKEMQASFKKNMDYEVWLYYANKKDIKDITVTTKQSLTQNIEKFVGKFSVVLIDEADQWLGWKQKPKGNAISMISVLCLIDCDRLYGLTGTPDREDMNQQDLELLYGKTIRLVGQKNNWYNYIPEIKQYIYTSETAFSYENIEDARQQIIGDDIRFYLQSQLIIREYNKDSFNYGIIMLDRVEQEANYYYNKFIEKNPEINTGLITGKTKEKDDDILIEKMKADGKGIIFCTKGKMGRGVDIPLLDCIFMYFPGNLPSSVIQAVGRILRIYWEKKPIVFDWHDNYGMFKHQGKRRIASYKKEYINPKISFYNIKPI